MPRYPDENKKEPCVPLPALRKGKAKKLGKTKTK
jgi:hypothetical protein